MLNVPTRVKDALKSGMYQKNHRMVVLDRSGAELFTIDNNSLVDGSVSYDERLCTGNILKFGLCEGSSLQFQYFNHESILGKRLQCFVDVQYKDADGILKWYSIPMGFYDVDQCPMQFSTGIKKVTAYNKLRSDYFDKDITAEYKIAANDGERLIELLDYLLRSESISKKEDILLNSDFRSNSRVYVKNVFTEYSTESPTSKTGNYLKQVILESYIGKDLKANDYYRLFVWAKDINEYIETLRNGKVDRSKYYSVGINPSITAAQKWDYWQTKTESNGIIKYGSQIVVHSDALQQNLYTSFEFSEYNPWLMSDWMDNISGDSGIIIRLPLYYEYDNKTTFSNDYVDVIDRNLNELFNRLPNAINFYRRNISEIEKLELNRSMYTSSTRVTMRELQSAVFEINCEFGQLDRESNLFSGIQLNNARFLPSETLYPSNSITPNGNAEHIMRSGYEKLWTDSQGVQKFRNLIVTYKSGDSENTLTKEINPDGNIDYEMSSNWLFKNIEFSISDINQYADAMVEKMRNITWFPFEMWAAGLPYVETGDELEITTPNGTYTSYVLTRTLKGIQNMHDTYINGTLDVF